MIIYFGSLGAEVPTVPAMVTFSGTSNAFSAIDADSSIFTATELSVKS